MSTDVLIIYGAVISVLIAIVGYFLNKQIAVIEELTKAVSALNITVSLIQSNQSNFTVSCAKTHLIIDHRFNSHSEKLHEYGLAITDLKVDIARLKEQ